MFSILEGWRHVHQKRMRKPRQKLFLVHDWGHGLFVDDLNLAHFFHREDLSGLFVLHFPHLSKASLADGIQYIEHLLWYLWIFYWRTRGRHRALFSWKRHLVNLEKALSFFPLGHGMLKRHRLFSSWIGELHRDVVTGYQSGYMDTLGFWKMTEVFSSLKFRPKLPPRRCGAILVGLLLESSVSLLYFFGERVVRMGVRSW